MFITHFDQLTSELFIRTFAYDERRECFLQPLHNTLQWHEIFILRRVVRRQIGELNHSPIVEHLLEVGVLLDNPAIFLIIIPVAAALLQLSIELCVKQVVVDDARIINLVGIDADEAS